MPVTPIPDEIRKVSNVRGALVIAQQWVVMLLLFWFVIRFPHPVVWIICYVLLARQSLALFILYHDASHKLLFTSKRINDFAGEWLCGAPMTFVLEHFKAHMAHHKEPLVSSDPEIKMTGGYPIPRASLLRKLFRDLIGITNFRGHLLLDYQKARESSFKLYIPMVTMSFLMWSGFYLAGHPWYFFIFWMLPGATVAVVFVRLGGLAQHAGLKPNRDQRLCTRTVVSPVSFFLAPVCHNYHVEHHLYPQVPCYNLPRLHRYLHRHGVLAPEHKHTSYWKVFKQLVY